MTLGTPQASEGTDDEPGHHRTHLFGFEATAP
jgi:hypothetical protein